MTNNEIRQEAKKDFLELSGKIRMALERFNKSNCNRAINSGLTINDVPRSLIAHIVEQRKWVTRRHNTWYTYFRFDNLPGGEGLMNSQYFIYTPVYRETGIEYIFLNNLNHLFVERFTLHFTDRYKERHLTPRGIDTKGLPVPLHFNLHNSDSFPGKYYKNSDVGVEEGGNHRFWIATEGIVVTDYIDDMLTYLTFMDRDDLSPLKAQVYEEEKVWHYMKIATDNSYDEDSRTHAITSLAAMPDFGDIMQRFAQRNLEDKGDGSKQATIENMRQVWENLKRRMPECRKTGERNNSEIMRLNRTTDSLFLNSLRETLDIKSYHLPPGAKREEKKKENWEWEDGV